MCLLASPCCIAAFFCSAARDAEALEREIAMLSERYGEAAAEAKNKGKALREKEALLDAVMAQVSQEISCMPRGVFIHGVLGTPLQEVDLVFGLRIRSASPHCLAAQPLVLFSCVSFSQLMGLKTDLATAKAEHAAEKRSLEGSADAER